jgi:hypothetical protein
MASACFTPHIWAACATTKSYLCFSLSLSRTQTHTRTHAHTHTHTHTHIWYSGITLIPIILETRLRAFTMRNDRTDWGGKNFWGSVVRFSDFFLFFFPYLLANFFPPRCTTTSTNTASSVQFNSTIIFVESKAYWIAKIWGLIGVIFYFLRLK